MDPTLFEPIHLFLLFSLIIGFCVHWTSKQINGFQLSYLLLFCMYFLDTLTTLGEIKASSSLLFSPNLFSLVVSCFFLSFSERLPLKNRVTSLTIYSIGICIVTYFVGYPVLVGYLYVMILYLIGMRTRGWITFIPDLSIILTAILFPMTLFVLNMSSSSFLINGMLIGMGVGAFIEKIKLNTDYPSSYSLRMKALLIGLVGVILLFIGMWYISEFFSIFVGLWVTFVAPILFVKAALYQSRVKNYALKQSFDQ